MRFSANLGFLWNDRPLPEAIRAAKAAGFDAVECHWPYDVPAASVKAALDETGLPMLGLNTRRGDVGAGDNGLSAIPGRETEARAAIDEAVAYARALGTPNIHVMAGFAEGEAARQTFVSNLPYACETAAPHGITILIEPLNRYDDRSGAGDPCGGGRAQSETDVRLLPCAIDGRGPDASDRDAAAVGRAYPVRRCSRSRCAGSRRDQL